MKQLPRDIGQFLQFDRRDHPGLRHAITCQRHGDMRVQAELVGHERPMKSASRSIVRQTNCVSGTPTTTSIDASAASATYAVIPTIPGKFSAIRTYAGSSRRLAVGSVSSKLPVSHSRIWLGATATEKATARAHGRSVLYSATRRNTVHRASKDSAKHAIRNA